MNVLRVSGGWHMPPGTIPATAGWIEYQDKV